MDEMEPKMAQGGIIVEHHDTTMFPERWFSLVVVLRCKTESIFDRLTARFRSFFLHCISFFPRGYPQSKVTENVEAEIMGVCEEGARESYQQNIIYTFNNDTLEELEETVTQLLTLIPEQ